MPRTSRISFAIDPFEGGFVVVPILNGTHLTELIGAFEKERDYEPAGGYGGLNPQWFNYGPLDTYFLGNFDEDSYFGRLGHIYLLECTCGEAGCWPLAARIKVGRKRLFGILFSSHADQNGTIQNSARSSLKVMSTGKR